MKILFSITAIFLLLTSCKKNNESDCEQLKTGLLNKGPTKVKTIVNKFTSDLFPVSPTVQDPYGQKDNLNKLALRITGQCELSATVFCYGCEYSLPQSSLINIYIKDNGIMVRRTLQIAITPDYKLKCGINI